MRSETASQNSSILLKTMISKKIMVDQVWSIYNESVPRTNKQSKIDKENIKYINKKNRVELNFGATENEYIKTAESEERSRVRYDEFNEIVKKDLKTVLNLSCKPLLCYLDSRKTPEIPVIVAATFAAICDMRKYKTLTPKKMLYATDKEIEETVETLITHSVGYVLKYYDRSDYFLLKIAENLKYFFNIDPDSSEKNVDKVGGFNYKILKSDSNYLIEKDLKDENGETVELNEHQILTEIDEFLDDYVKAMKRQAVIKEKVNSIINMVDNILASFSGDESKKIRSKVIGSVLNTYCITEKYSDELLIVFPLDFTEPEFNDCHTLLTDELKLRFYSERNQKLSRLGKRNKDYYEQNALYNEVGLIEREKWLEDMIKKELKNLNNSLYMKREQRIESLRISEA